MIGTRITGTRITIASACAAALALAVALATTAGCRSEHPPNTGAPAAGTEAVKPLVAHAPATAAASGSTQPAIVLSPAIPGDLTFGGTVSLPALQKDFDILSWNSFISLDWPPDRNGVGDPTKTIGQNGDNPTVWEDYSDVATVFLPGGATPKWRAEPPVPDVCKDLYTPGAKIISQIGKTPTLLSEFSQPFNTGPLIDQNGVYSRFQITINKPMFDYILGNALYSRAGQSAFTGEVKFPCGANPTPTTQGVEGAIMVKSAWKVITPAQRGQFHTAEALVYTPPTQNPQVPAACSKQLIGLVGLHIAHKTSGSSQWVWSTFEHIDNAPTAAEVKSGHLKAAYNFYDPKCPQCKPNEVPPRPWNPTLISSFHTQVVREFSFKGNEFAPESAAARNADARKLLASVNPKSVWRNYELISTQWPTNPGGPCAPKPGDQLGSPAPVFLANTTLETYIQGMVPNVSSSCIECHNNAAMTSKVPSDFTYVLQRAK
jgi:hypothetical protein